jgi:hypothetical protein
MGCKTGAKGVATVPKRRNSLLNSTIYKNNRNAIYMNQLYPFNDFNKIPFQTGLPHTAFKNTYSFKVA